jgi:hypothetical protein
MFLLLWKIPNGCLPLFIERTKSASYELHTVCVKAIIPLCCACGKAILHTRCYMRFFFLRSSRPLDFYVQFKSSAKSKFNNFLKCRNACFFYVILDF